jgi:hypothetical protein
MNDHLDQLRAMLDAVRTRWQRVALLRAWALGATTAGAMLLVGLLAVWLIAPDGLGLVLVAAVVLTLAALSLVLALLPIRRSPSDIRIARFIEEQAGGLDDVLVTAVERALTTPAADAPPPIAERVMADAARVAQGIALTDVIRLATVRRAAAAAALGCIALAVSAALFAPSAVRAGRVAGAYLFPRWYTIDVTPGSTKVRAGTPLTIAARIAGLDGGLVPMLTLAAGGESRTVRMAPGDLPGEFMLTLTNLASSFTYEVSAAGSRSATYTVTVVRPPKVARIDLRYEYPQELGLQPHTETDGGDIYAPAGTTVRMRVVADKPIRQGRLGLGDGRELTLVGSGPVLTGDLTVSRDGSYRVVLDDVDGLVNTGDTEYFIRVLDDRPPSVRILRPGGDRQVSPLEEVTIEARADDDFGLSAFELVFSKGAGTARGRETVVALPHARGEATATGAHMLYLEDLGVQPGDFVTYYARARDVARGRRSTEARSDIFFLEVKPYEEEFVAAQSQAMGGMQAEQTDLDALIAAEKDIIAATWKLDARGRTAGDRRSADDIRAVGQAQSGLKVKTEAIAGEVARAGQDPRFRSRRFQPGVGPGADDPMTRAVEAMGRAAAELNRLTTASALPFELDALDHLLKAAAEVRRRQVQRQQANGRGGGGNRQSLDLSTLFDQELRRQQRTNYETPTTNEARAEENAAEDPLDKIRDLAARQEALARQQRDLAKQRDQLDAEELRRQLERLTREQNELRQQAEDLAAQVQRQSQNQPSSPSQASSRGGQGQSSSPSTGSAGSSGADSQRLRDIAQEMRNAAGDLRRQDVRQAAARGDRARQQLRNLEQRMQSARPDERRRALGDLQLEARQLADAERRVASEGQAVATGPAGDDARRRLAAEQERLAERADRMSEALRQLGKAATDADPDEQRAVGDATREADRQRIGQRMRESADALRKGAAGRESRDAADSLARGLDRVAERLGAATGARDRETARLSEQLSRMRELRDKVADVDRSMDALSRAGSDGQANAESSTPSSSQSGSPASQASGSPQAQSGGQTGGGTSGQPRVSQPGGVEPGAGEGGRAATIERLQRDMREAERLAGELKRQNPEAMGGSPEQWQRSFSAPGTEGFKQDFAKWESLKKNLLSAIERSESRVSDQLRARETEARLNAGRHEAVSDTYRELVDRYYQLLAAPTRPPR